MAPKQSKEPEIARVDIHPLTEEERNLVGWPYPEDTQTVEVVLSERNLLSLLSKLYTPGSKKTLFNGDAFEEGEPVHNCVLKLIAEKDDEHYGKREMPPGFMHPVTEMLVASLKEYWKERND